MHSAHDLLTRWPVLDASAKRARLQQTFQIAAGPLRDALSANASDAERARHAKEWPKDAIPPKEKPPFNRDWRLPKGPF